MKEVLELQQIPEDNEVQPQVGPTITTVSAILTTFWSTVSNNCDRVH
ncbi:hypothetical protein SAMN05216389_11261 [Oceanobacillus limi]|uniref:Uncharacterized protein n=1 Tax=Oceanobacillus limi TaxID=930131 RepID=A0A1I0ES29_9BACI|nr:class III lanthipeptide [Oceanobacillus limi]SET47907.1 hypothetical protein SAMN05216389_11261 [Oceanobacillus limi]